MAPTPESFRQVAHALSLHPTLVDGVDDCEPRVAAVAERWWEPWVARDDVPSG